MDRWRLQAELKGFFRLAYIAFKMVVYHVFRNHQSCQTDQECVLMVCTLSPRMLGVVASRAASTTSITCESTT